MSTAKPSSRLPRILRFTFFVFLLASCSPSLPETAPPPYLTPDTVTPDILPSAPPTLIPPTETPTATPIPPNTRPQYTMDVQFHYANKSAFVNETIVYTNNSADTLTSLVLAVEPTCSNSFALVSLGVDGAPVANYIFDYQNVQPYIRHRLEIPLAAPLAPNGQDKVQIGFGLVLPVVGNFSAESSLCSQI